MSPKNIYLFLFIALIASGRLFEKRLYQADGSYVVDQEGTTPATVDLKKGGKKKAVYPPVSFSDAVIGFRKKIGRFPATILELQDLRIENRKLINDMFDNHFSTLEVSYSSTDSLEMRYGYDRFMARELAQLNKSGGRMYNGKYIYTFRDGQPTIRYSIDRAPLIRISKEG